MKLYGKSDKSISRKTVVLLLETVILLLSYWILFGNSQEVIKSVFGPGMFPGSKDRRMIIFLFNCIVYVRIWITMFYLIERNIPWEEAFSIPIAFAVYYIGFALLGYSTKLRLNLIDGAGIIIFILGSFINTYSEIQRKKWKKDPAHKGHLYTKELFRYSMHINYFGDLLWVTGYAIVTRNIFSLIIVIMIFCFFIFYNIPKLDKYLEGKYHSEFAQYKKHTRKFIPYIY